MSGQEKVEKVRGVGGESEEVRINLRNVMNK